MTFRLSIVASFVVAVFLGSAATAEAGPRSKLLINTDRPIGVMVDGKALEYVEDSSRVELHGVEPGVHLVEFRNFFGKLVGEGKVTFPAEGDAIIRAQWKNKTFSVYDTVLLEAETASAVVVETPAPAHSASVQVGHSGVHTSESTTTTTTTTTSTAMVPGMGLHLSATVNESGGHMSVGGMHSEVTVTETHTTTSAPEVVVVEEAVPATRTITFRTTDEEWANVYIDGAKVWEIRAMDEEKTVTVTTGEHVLEVKDFMENNTWCKGRLIVDGYTDLIIGITKEKPVEVYNDSDAFRR